LPDGLKDRSERREEFACSIFLSVKAVLLSIRFGGYSSKRCKKASCRQQNLALLDCEVRIPGARSSKQNSLLSAGPNPGALHAAGACRNTGTVAVIAGTPCATGALRAGPGRQFGCLTRGSYQMVQMPNATPHLGVNDAT